MILANMLGGHSVKDLLMLSYEKFKHKMVDEKDLGARPGFYKWLCQYEVDDIVSGMLKPVREEHHQLSLHMHVNAMLKRKVEYKKNELPVFMNHLKQLVDEQERWREL